MGHVRTVRQASASFECCRDSCFGLIGRHADVDVGPATPRPRRTEVLERHVRIASVPIDDILVRYGKCCNPVPGDEIVGFITRGRGVTVHTTRCDKILGIDPERRVDVSWDVKGDFKRAISLRVITSDRPGILARISQTFSEAGVNISQASCRTTPGERAVNEFEVTIGDLKQLNSIVRSLEKIEGVQSVSRV